MQSAWSGEAFSFEGRHFVAQETVALPRPVQRPGPPVWIGGNSKRAIRRAVELADGWAPMPNAASTAARRHSPAMETLDELVGRIDYARAHAEAVGRRTPLTIACSLGGLAMDTEASGGDDLMVETAQRLASVGATYLYGGVHTPVENRAEFCAEVLRMGESLVPRLAAIEVADPLGTGETPR